MITVIDSPCGAGKTTWAIKYMRDNPNKKFVYLTPYLSEVDRISKEIPTMCVPMRKTDTKGKYYNFKELLSSQESIVSTHALFSLADLDVCELIKAGGYTLIMDEVMEVIKQDYLTKDDLGVLNDSTRVTIDKDGKINWVKDKYNKGQFDYLKIKCESWSLYKQTDTEVFWTFPEGVLKAFSDVFVLTYMFDCQLQRCYFDLYKLQYTMKSVNKGNIVDYKAEQIDLSKLHILEDTNYNSIGDDKYSLSKSWYEKQKNNMVKSLQSKIYNFVKHSVKAKSSDVMWTTFIDYRGRLKGKGYTKGFISCNSRATNEYAYRHCLVYTINRFISPPLKKFLSSHNLKLDEDYWAASELIQFICRSAIRNGEDVYLYLPSKRMRDIIYYYKLGYGVSF